MTEWDQPIDNYEPDTSLASVAFVAFAVGIVWLICAPFDLYARIRDRHTRNDATGDDAGADWSAEGAFQFHDRSPDQ